MEYNYGPKYRFDFESQNGTAYQIELLKKDYEGEVFNRALGQAPVFRQERSGHILGSSLSMFIECQQDGEFAELYTPDPTTWRVDLYTNADDEDNIRTLWSGFVTPELYSEPDIFPPYDVQITATDGLGELKYIDFDPDKVTPDGTEPAESWASLVRYLLEQTGLPFGYTPYFISSLKVTTSAGSVIPANFGAFYGDHEVFRGKTCYEVLEAVLTALNCYVFRNGHRWYFMRYNDMKLTGSTVRTVYDWAGNDVAAGNLPAFGYLSGSWWPVGNLSTTIQPAKKQVGLSHVLNYKTSINADPDMDEDGSWTLTGTAARYILNRGAASIDNGYLLGSIQHSLGKLSQSFSVPALDLDLVLALYALDMNPTTWGTQNTLRVQLINTPTGGAARYLHRVDRPGGVVEYTWTETASFVSLDLQTRQASARNTAEVECLELPFYGLKAGRVDLVVYNDSQGLVFVGGAGISADTTLNPTGFTCRATINNGARNKSDEVKLDVMTGDRTWRAISSGIISGPSGSVITKLSNGSLEASRSLEFLALDYAREVALPRLKTTGKINTPAGCARPLGFLRARNAQAFFLETFSWDLLYDEMEVELVSLPAASIALDSFTITTSEDWNY